MHQVGVGWEIRPLSCQERGCVLLRFEGASEQGAPMVPVRYQHGENPEAVFDVSPFDSGLVRTETWRRFMHEDGWGYVPPSAVEDWVERVHAYEDGQGGQ